MASRGVAELMVGMDGIVGMDGMDSIAISAVITREGSKGIGSINGC